MSKRSYGDAVALSTALLVAGLAVGPSQAQAAEKNGSSQQPVQMDESGGKVEEVVVTARRRNERMEDVPITIAALSGMQAKRRGIDNTEDLVVSTPGLDFSRQSSFGATPFLRGVGSPNAAAGNESPVAIYVDGVYIASPNATLFELNDIKSIQVLYGPQGTLFGRNATGGVIQIETEQPSFTPGGRVSVGYGNYNTATASLYATTALSDNVAVSVAASGRRQADGFGHSVTTGVEVHKGWDWNVRAKLLADLTDATTVLLEGDYSVMKSDIGSNINIYPGSTGVTGTHFVGYYNTNTVGTDFTKVKQGGVSLRIDHQASFADIVSISAYRFTDMRSSVDQDGAAARLVDLELTSPTRTFSQELRLVSKADSALKWVVGGYYYYQDAQYDPALQSGTPGYLPAPPPFDTVYFNTEQKLDSFAGFAEGTYGIFPRTHLTLGIRYTNDSYKMVSTGAHAAGVGLPTVLIPGSTFTTKAKFPKLTYRAILDYKFTPDVMGYVSYSRGFKSGGYNLSNPFPQNALRPEVLDAYEIGLKSTLLDGRLVFNASGYYYNYKNLILDIIQQNNIMLINAAAAEIKGADASFTARPLSGLQVTGGFSFTDAKYTKFPAGPKFTPLSGPPYGNVLTAENLAGNTMQHAPRYTFSLAPSYSIHAGNGEITLAASYYYNSGYYGDPDNRLKQPSYSLVNASVGYDWDAGLGVRLWVKNLSDTHRFVFFAPDTLKDAATYAAPRMYGFTLSKNF